MADGETALPELFSRFIFKPAWFPHERWRRVGVDRHFAVVVECFLEIGQRRSEKSGFVFTVPRALATSGAPASTASHQRMRPH